MIKYIKSLISIIIIEYHFLCSLLFRIIYLIGQCFPSNQRGNKIRGFIHRPFLKKCGKNFQVAIGVELEHMANIEIGNDVYIGNKGWISGLRGGIVLEDEVMIGPSVSMVSSNHTMKNNSFRFGPGIGSSIRIGKGTWIAANVVITSGVTIKDCCLIAAGSVVTKNFDSFSIVAGVPAKKIGDCHEKFSI